MCPQAPIFRGSICDIRRLSLMLGLLLAWLIITSVSMADDPKRRKFREELEILPAKELIAHAGVAVIPINFESTPTDGAEVSDGDLSPAHPYIAVRALVPVGRQIENAKRNLKHARFEDASADVLYTDYVLERQITRAGGHSWAEDWNDAWWPEQWDTIDPAPARELLSRAIAFDPDPVDPIFQNAVVTMPLPFRKVCYWGQDSTHPKLPNSEQEVTDNVSQCYLFRYFDFSVQPGLAYRYRLKLELTNPNYDRPFEEVVDPASTKGAYRTSDWSNTTKPVLVSARLVRSKTMWTPW